MQRFLPSHNASFQYVGRFNNKMFNAASHPAVYTVTGTLSLDRGPSIRKTRSGDRTRLYATAYGQTEEKNRTSCR